MKKQDMMKINRFVIPFVLPVAVLFVSGCFSRKRKPVQCRQPQCQKDSGSNYVTADTPLTEGRNDVVAEVVHDDIPVLSFFEPDEDTEEVAGMYLEDASLFDGVDDSVELSWSETDSDVDLKNIYFDYDKHQIRTDQLSSVEYDVEQLRLILEQDPQVTIVLGGHCDTFGPPAYNVSLSLKRAKQVAELLAKGGIAEDRIKIVGRGQEEPVIIDGKPVTGDQEAQWPNRRVEIKTVTT
jgi:outer membrane protein OmpA-like peptidoglycan-associated protein